MPPAGRAVTRADWWRAVAIALVASAMFLLVARASGTLDVAGGFGWDGVAYAHMVTDSLRAGTGNTAMRPLVILAVRVPYFLGADLLTSFRYINMISAAALFVGVALLLARRGASPLVQALVPINLALCIASSKMYGFYPALIDLGALAVITVAYYLIASEHLVFAAVACVAAGFSREFAMAVVLFGVHRAIRLRRSWAEIAAVYLPALLVPLILRVPAFGFVAATSGPSTLANAIAGAGMLTGKGYLAAFAYFSATLFGGLSLFLLIRLPACMRSLRREPENLTFLAVVFALAIAAGVDIWRYTVYALPAVIVLAAACFEDLDLPTSRIIAVAVLAITVLTQRPLEQMTTERYFRDWFPTYLMASPGPVREELFRIWWPRLAAIPVCGFGLGAVLYWRRWRSGQMPHART